MMNVQSGSVFRGDNLAVMRGMDSGTFDLIATDPPFGKLDFYRKPTKPGRGNTWNEISEATEGVHEAYLELQSHHEQRLLWLVDLARLARGDRAWAFMTFMTIRALEMHRLLRPSGSLFWHCDPDYSHYLKVMLDIVFGSGNFRNEVVWQRTKSKTTKRQLGKLHDTLLFYVKGPDWTFNAPLVDHAPGHARSHNRTDERGDWTSMCLTASEVRNKESGLPWRGIDPADSGRHWSTPTKGQVSSHIRENFIPDWPDGYATVHERLDALDRAGLIHWPKKRGGIPRLKKYREATKGKVAGDLWTDIPHVSDKSLEYQNYRDQKPQRLYERIIGLASNRGDWVLDPFCGCATTLQAAEALDRKWVGIDGWSKVVKTVQRRMPAGTSIRTFKKPPAREDDGAWAITATYELDESTAALKSMPRKVVRRLMNPMNLPRQECVACCRVFPDITFGHLTSVSRGGALNPENLVWLCKGCNGRMSDKWTLDWLIKENKRLGIRRAGNREPASDELPGIAI